MKYKIEWIYKMKGSEGVTLTSDWMDGEKAILYGEDMVKSNRTSELIFYDEMGQSWNLKELKKLHTEIETAPHDCVIYFDGSFHRETQEAGLGAVVYYRQGKKKYRLRANAAIAELENNNEAEYAALMYAVNLLEDIGVQQIPCDIKGDAQGVLMLLAGEWPCYEENLNKWLDRIEAKIRSLKLKPRYQPIPRNENKEAHKLAAQALEGKQIHSKMQLL